MKLLNKGKVKDVYEVNENELEFLFTSRAAPDERQRISAMLQYN